MPRILIATALAAGLVALAPSHAAAESAGPLWATVNVCNPTQVGVRASLPGNGTRQRMRVRFTAQWFSPQARKWVPVGGAATSPWVDAGTAEYVYQQAGWTFHFEPLPAGTHFQVRGLAEMQWLSGRVVRSTTRVTHAGAAGVDVGSSLTSCSIG